MPKSLKAYEPYITLVRSRICAPRPEHPLMVGPPPPMCLSVPWRGPGARGWRAHRFENLAIDGVEKRLSHTSNMFRASCVGMPA